MVIVNISQNAFDGELLISALPASMEIFVGSYNQFSGPLNLTGLPSTIGTLELERYRFSGSLRLVSLPASIEALVLCENRFDIEKLIVGEIPPNLLRLDVSADTFSRVEDPDGNLFHSDVLL